MRRGEPTFLFGRGQSGGGGVITPPLKKMASLCGICVAIIHERDHVGGAGAVAAKSISRSVNLFLAQHLFGFLFPFLPSTQNINLQPVVALIPSILLSLAEQKWDPLPPPSPPSAPPTTSKRNIKQRRKILSSTLSFLLPPTLCINLQPAEPGSR